MKRTAYHPLTWVLIASFAASVPVCRSVAEPPSKLLPKPELATGSWPAIRVPLTKLHDITDIAPVIVTDQLGNPAVVDGAVFVQRGTEFALLDIAAKGEKQIRWQVDAEGLVSMARNIDTKKPIYPGITLVGRVVQGGTRIVVAGEDRVVSFDSKTGKTVWTHKLEEAGALRRAAMDDRQVVVSGPDQIEVISAKTGKLQWAGPVSGKLVGGDGQWKLGPVLMLPGSIVIPSKAMRQLIIYDRITGKLVGKINASGPAVMTCARVSDDTILVVDGQQVDWVRIDTKACKLYTTEVELTPLVKREEDKNNAPLYREIIGSGPGGIVVGNNFGGEISAEWIRFSGPQVRVQTLSLPVQKKGESVMTAARAYVWNDRVVIWANRSRRLPAQHGLTIYSSRGMWGFGFQINESKPTWTMQRVWMDNQRPVIARRGLQGKTHLIWLQQKYTDTGQWKSQLMVLDYRTGAMVQESKLPPGNSSYQYYDQPLRIKEDIVLSLPGELSVWSQKNEKPPAGKAPAGRGK
jgi:hypothetical protein